MENITEEIRETLRKPLPKEAISQHPTKKYLSTIKAIYVVERLNDVFGVGGWRMKNEVITEKEVDDGKKKKTMVVMKSTLTVAKYGVEVEQFGGNDNDDLGDAYKGACTDALTKIGSYLEIGIDVFKGLKTAPQANSKAPKAITGRPDQPTCKVCGELASPSKFPKPGATHYCQNYRSCGKDTIIYPDTRSEFEKKIGAELDAIPDVDISLIK